MTMPLSLDEGDSSDLFHLINLFFSNFHQFFTCVLLFLIKFVLLLIVDSLSSKDFLLFVLWHIALLCGKGVHVFVAHLVKLDHF